MSLTDVVKRHSSVVGVVRAGGAVGVEDVPVDTARHHTNLVGAQSALLTRLSVDRQACEDTRTILSGELILT